MAARNAQIRDWINTGKHVILTDYEHAASDPSASNSGDFDETDANSVSGDGSSVVSSTASTAAAPIVEKLLASDNDALVPKQAEVDIVFQKGKDLWSKLVTSSRSLPATSLSAGLNDPSIILKDVPALPKALPRCGMLVGRPFWHVLGISIDRDDEKQNEDFDFQHIHGARKHFCLSYPTPVECRVSPQVAIGNDSASRAPGDGPYPPGLLLLTLCWSYVFSVRFWELQGKQVLYTSHALQPRSNGNIRNRRGRISIYLGASASQGLMRWLCALLAPKPGWSVQGGGYAPWTAFYSGGVEFTIISDEATTFTPNGQAPSSAEAIELLVELGCLYGFDSAQHSGRRNDPLSPIVAGFVAVLALPFYRVMELQPQFLAPTLRLNPTEVRPGPIRQYLADLRYYMTLSMHPMSVGSIIWSIFWQPDVECNVVSPWLSSTLSELRPLIDSGNLDILAKTFALRRPRVALWWLGIFLLGSPAIPGLIVRYLETSEERWGYATMASPDTTVSSWTGSPQSFLDEGTSRAYIDLNESVSKADLLRCRYNLRLQDTSSALLSWQPFGVTPKTMIEPDLWPWLECRFDRTYEHWVWYIKKGETVVRQDVQEGFRKDTGSVCLPLALARLFLSELQQPTWADVGTRQLAQRYCLHFSLSEAFKEAAVYDIAANEEDVQSCVDDQLQYMQDFVQNDSKLFRVAVSHLTILAEQPTVGDLELALLDLPRGFCDIYG
ncbi:uncharacterized protein NECHADRAFT_78166 [Fusarium vanettenii 77-13-4]|uniref:Uncharacterized protein n=1 Tax=Fusarium vanettenii (strain ATCC MYA-4622 / CBS 123669 / FGSC 9596 / NRRL 45880 / 77-13-4) TaxID=660122 RepID=C7YNB0_FUSV7|nr:uncharacterized protein NECHADRAFT_78166 [Fusarium vanettenii 77-13-4]EEU47589.1 predicted protein [Fusarium vanettenii 77-13-4]